MTTGTRLGGRDALVGFGVAAALVVAMVGLFLYERAQFGEHDVTWTITEASATPQEATLSEGEEVVLTFEATAENIANIRVGLEWSDDVGDPDTFRIEVTGPEGATADPEEGAQSPLEATVSVTEVPADGPQPGRDAEEAANLAGAQHQSMAGQGTWTVTITLVSAPGAAGTGPTGVGAQADGANDVTVTFYEDVYAPTAAQ